MTHAGYSVADGPVRCLDCAEQLAEQRRLLPTIAFDRLWLNSWTSGSGDAIDPGDLAAAFEPVTNIPADPGDSPTSLVSTWA